MKAKLLRLHPQDNVVVATAPIKPGTVLRLDRVKLQVITAVPMAGKVASRPIAEGEKIIKFGQPIGHATKNIEPGEWVHTHNLASDYLPTLERPTRTSHPAPQPAEMPPAVAEAATTTTEASETIDLESDLAIDEGFAPAEETEVSAADISPDISPATDGLLPPETPAAEPPSAEVSAPAGTAGAGMSDSEPRALAGEEKDKNQSPGQTLLPQQGPMTASEEPQSETSTPGDESCPPSATPNQG